MRSLRLKSHLLIHTGWDRLYIALPPPTMKSSQRNTGNSPWSSGIEHCQVPRTVKWRDMIWNSCNKRCWNLSNKSVTFVERGFSNEASFLPKGKLQCHQTLPLTHVMWKAWTGVTTNECWQQRWLAAAMTKWQARWLRNVHLPSPAQQTSSRNALTSGNEDMSWQWTPDRVTFWAEVWKPKFQAFVWVRNNPGN